MSATQTPPDRSAPAGVPIHEPVMKVNLYDRLSAWMISCVIGLLIGVFCVVTWWLTTRPPSQEFLVPMEMVAASGGSESGSPDETLSIESPEDPTENAASSEDVQESDPTEIVQSVVELANQATQQADQVLAQNASSGGSPGSVQGTGRRALGSGPGEGGIPNEERWVIRYADDTSLAEYAKQLDHFGIELGALLPDGQLVYMSKVSSNAPVKRVSTSGKGEQRLYMTWQGGSRKEADAKLFARIDVDVSKAVLFHFYSKSTEQLLLTKEFQFAKRKAQEIRRTYFVVVKQGAGYDFVVTRQVPMR